MDKEQELLLEKAELDAIVGRGVTFEIDDYDLLIKKYFFGLFKKKKIQKIKRSFTIRELTLSTMDRLSREWIEFDLDESRITSDDALEAAKIMTAKHAYRCAHIVAIAVLNTEILIPKNSSGRIIYVEDTKRIEQLSALFFRQLKPSKLYNLYTLVNTMCNFGDFISSIRLMKCERTTMPIRIENN